MCRPLGLPRPRRAHRPGRRDRRLWSPRPAKGFDLLIRAYRQVKGQAVLRIHGEGPERAALEALAEGDRRIQFTGFVADPAAAMAQCDAVVMPSRWEPYGIVALEALTARRPLLTSPSTG
ncbi:glycosyltransferase [Seohaeicola zhoushanensis]